MCFHIHDYVAVLSDIDNTPITQGTLGTIVDQLSDTVFLVEFSDKDGQVYKQLPISKDHLLSLHYVVDETEMEYS